MVGEGERGLGGRMCACSIPFDGCFECLCLDTVGLPDGEGGHVRALSCSAVHTPC